MVGDVCCCQGIGIMVLLLRHSCYYGRKNLSRYLSRGERASRGDVGKERKCGRQHLMEELICFRKYRKGKRYEDDP